MPIVRAQAVIPYDSGLPQDVITNTFYFQSGGALAGMEAASAYIAESLDAFYTQVYEIGGAYYCNFTGAYVNCYDMSEPEPRIPWTQPMGISVGSESTGLPAEVAAVLSFHAETVPGGNPANRRGRVYLGGLVTNQMLSTGSYPGWNSGFITDCTLAGEGLLARNTSDMTWMIHSQKLNVNYPVVGGWFDNDPDTQRRRGFGPTSRTTWG